MDKHFIRIGFKLYGIAAIRKIIEVPLPPEKDPHPGRSPIPLRKVTIQFTDGSEEVLTGEEADFFAARYRPLAFTLDDGASFS